ncbi:MAG TPA: hypothetical protein VL156_07095 [Terriglobales bacterium]|jgi:hypothetical protein|nr:hypothetical protein [Terriglobales bacterium]
MFEDEPADILLTNQNSSINFRGESVFMSVLRISPGEMARWIAAELERLGKEDAQVSTDRIDVLA